VNIIAFRLPNVDAATNRGIHQDIQPSIRSANVYTDAETDRQTDRHTPGHLVNVYVYRDGQAECKTLRLSERAVS